MKLKFLSLFLALGMFALGTSASAQDDKMPSVVDRSAVKPTEMAGGICPASSDDGYIKLWDAALNKGVCSILRLDSKLQQACNEMCNDASKLSTDVPSKDNVVKCAEAVEAAASGNPSIASAVKQTVSAGCFVLCSGKQFGVGCNSCSYSKTKELCGSLCCNFGSSAVGALGACLSYNKSSCKDYQ